METNAILAVNSLNRYTTNAAGQQNQPLANALQQQYYLSETPGDPNDNGYTAGPPCNNFSITSPGAIIYGYISKIIVAEIQLNYNIPTIIPGVNDTFWIIQGSIVPLSDSIKVRITIPYGFYTPDELAAVLQVVILQSQIGQVAPKFTVTYFSSTENSSRGFIFSGVNDNFEFFFPSLYQLNVFVYNFFPIPAGDPQWIDILKCYRTLGLSSLNAGTYNELFGSYNGQFEQVSTTAINLLYTPYIDICSKTLTKYQKVKDTDTSAQKIDSIISRVYLAGQGAPQYLDDGANGVQILGSRPFIVIQNTPNAKVIRWSKDEAVNSLDFQLRDQYGDLIFNSASNEIAYNAYYFFTEFQMTLLCIEGDD